MKQFKLFILLLLTAISAIAQETRPKTDTPKIIRPVISPPRPLVKKEWNKVLNNAFASLTGSAGNSNIIGNYGSFAPLNGNFTFKGTTAIGKEDSPNLGYLGITVSGGLLSGNYATLFEDTKLNTNASIQLQYDFRLGKNHFRTYASQTARYTMDYWAMSDSITKAKIKFRNEVHLIPEKIQIFLADSAVAVSELDTTAMMLEKTMTWAQPRLKDPHTPLKDRKKMRDSIDKLQTNMLSYQKNLEKIAYKLDSLRHMRPNAWSLIDYNNARQDSLQDKKNDKLQSRYRFEGLHFNWFTLIAGGGRLSYYTFDGKQPFSSQISKNALNTYKFGIAYNSYDQDNFTNHAWFVNGGVYIQRTNNTDQLSTTDVNQEVAFNNSAAKDTVRKVDKKYSAYTDPITNYRQLVLYGNIYYIFGSKTSGFHFFPSYYMPDHKKGFLDTGLGYLISYTNTAKDQPLINMEIYVQFNDVFNALDTPTKFINRNEIGLRFTLPFAFPIK